jgi:hypothetical protein
MKKKMTGKKKRNKRVNSYIQNKAKNKLNDEQIVF